MTDEKFNFQSLTNPEEEKIIQYGTFYVPGIIIASVLPLLLRLIQQEGGFYPILWAATIAMGPAIFILALLMMVQLGKKEPIDVKRIYKFPAFVFYMIFLVVGYQTVFTMDNKQQGKNNVEQEQPQQ